ncbi:MAG: DUF4492 domain-containing protein [Rikenellaceae bacterium]
MNPIKRVYIFYRNGFRSMDVGRTLWIIIAIKLFIMFAILKIFFFPSILGRFDSQQEKANYVRESLSTTERDSLKTIPIN